VADVEVEMVAMSVLVTDDGSGDSGGGGDSRGGSSSGGCGKQW
jgi:hypothetical protein